MALLQHQNEFHYQRVELFKTEALGVGSYGAVYKAKCDDLLCAAKILHPVLFQSTVPGTTSIMRRFEQECQILRMVRHPQIVQYLGTYYDPESRLPVLLMELMDESLTRFLEQSHELVPYHTEVNMCHDITMALSYLHSNRIIHRDLSSNNVLLNAGSCRAKVTDFGMANLSDTNAHLTVCPGTIAYMPPEAMEDPPVYTHKLDSFSFGVLAVQIITHLFPEPGSRFRIIDTIGPLSGRVRAEIPETERRQSHIELIDPTHPLLPVALDCLKDRERERPSCQELCGRMYILKASLKYTESVQQFLVSTRPTQSANRENREREIQQSQQMHEIQDLQQQLHAQNDQLHALTDQLHTLTNHLHTQDDQLREKEQEIQQQRHQILGLRTLLSTKHKQLAGKDHKVHTQGNQLHNQSDQQQQILRLQNLLTATNEQLQSLQQQLTTKNEQLADKDEQLTTKNEQLDGKDEQLATKNGQLADKDEQLADKEQQLVDKDEQLADNEQQLADKDSQLQQKEAVIAAHRQEIQQLRQQLESSEHVSTK